MKRAILTLILTSAWAQQDWVKLDQAAEAYYLKGDFPKALESAEMALKLAGSEKEKGRSLSLLGFLQHQSGQLAPAEEKLRAALEIRQRLAPDSADLAETLLNLAMLLRDTRRLPEAQQYAETASRLRMRALGGNHYLYAEALNMLGSIHQIKGEFEAAERIYEDGKRIHEAQSQGTGRVRDVVCPVGTVTTADGSF